METKKLLLVEDDKGIAMGLEYSLRQEGFETVVCTAVRPALERLQTERFDLAILDLSLPDGTGYDVCPGHQSQKRRRRRYLSHRPG